MNDQEVEEDDKPEIYPTGCILRIEIKDFLTYEHAIFTAGRHLNLIIGVNGSGKSSVICGICLAVGGNPKNLGRSESLGDFVRHGKDEAIVVLTISDTVNIQPQIIKLTIHRKESRADYQINGVKQTQKAVREFASKYNIQIDNPCTFLAQDKVKSFSEQNPVELLRNTEKAGDPKLLALHDELIKKRAEHKKIEDEKKSTEKRAIEIQGEMQTLEPRVENYYRQQLANNKIKTLHQYQKYQMFNEKTEAFTTMYENHKRLTEAKNRAQKAAENQRKKLEVVMENAVNFQKTHHSTKSKINHIKVELSKLKETSYDRLINEYQLEMNNVQEEFNKYIRTSREGAERKKMLEASLQDAENDLSHCPINLPVVEKSIKDLLDKIDQYDDDISQQERCRQRLSRQKQVLYNRSNIQSPYAEKMNYLGKMNAYEYSCAYQAWQWLEENDFGAEVHVPYFEIVINKDDARYIENLVRDRDLLMFIFESKDDEARFTKMFPKINSTLMTQPKESEISARIHSRFKELGFDKLAIETLYKSSPIVRQYLCAVSYLHLIPIAEREFHPSELAEKSRRLVECNIQRFVTKNRITSLKVSKYSGETLSSSKDIRNPRLLLCHEKPLESTVSLKHQKEQLEYQESMARQQIAHIQQKKEGLITQRKSLEEQKLQFQNLERKMLNLRVQLTTVTKNLEHIERTKPNIEKAKQDLERNKIHIGVKVETSALEIANYIEELCKYYAKKAISEAILQKINKERIQLDDQLEKKTRKFQEKEYEYDSSNTEMIEFRKDFDIVKENFQSTCGIPTTDESKLDASGKQKLERLKANFDDLNLVDKDKDEIDIMLIEEENLNKLRATDGTKADVDRYNILKVDAQEVGKSIKDISVKLECETENLRKDINTWKEPILKLISAINDNYYKFFNEIKCVGEVHLEIPEEPMNIADYGIMIMVSFRNSEKIRRLDHQVQSGGERSVSTMLYLLALQELCPVPFRCVDEINQGMDPTNERKVFDIMVKKLTGTGNLAKTQYFLLTPKLLHGLTFTDRVTVHCVHNSKALDLKAHQWCPDDFLHTMQSIH